MRYSFVIAALLASTAPALAEDWAPPVTDKLVQKECGSCHMAFQPAFLPARSWQRIMNNLSDHFGEDASLPADQVAAIRAYLSENAGDVQRRGIARKYMQWVAADGVPLKITENPAFLREHNFPDRVWKDPKVVTKSNCLACHAQADRGNYDDD
ncbi:diheme cytochrome c [Thalassospiraceae bacterium LMO-JJ14]|nr:diheme cytochrome c [Thalassospiraceae bacterium LMO-JJ14]